MSTSRDFRRSTGQERDVPRGRAATGATRRARAGSDLVGTMQHLQRTIGNTAVNALLSTAAASLQRQAEEEEPVQTTRASAMAVQRQEGEEEEEEAVQPMRASATAEQEHESQLGARIRTSAGRGSPLDGAVQRTLEAGLGAVLSGVRVHTDGEADHLSRSVDAVAFTSGSDIYFRQGAYAPGSREGLRTLAHEASHVVQQAAGPVAGTPAAGGVSISDPGDGFERAADAAAQQVTASDAPAQATRADGAAVQRASAGPGGAPLGQVLALQGRRRLGNQAVLRLIGQSSAPVQRVHGGPHKVVDEEEPAIQRAVTPTFPVDRPAPKRSNTDSSTTRVKEQTFTGTVKKDDAKKIYTYDLTSFTSKGEIQLVYYTNDHYPAPTPEDDSGALSNVTTGTKNAIADDLHSKRTGIAGKWSAYRAEPLHEDYHWNTEWVNTFTPELRKAEDDLKKIKTPLKKGVFGKKERTAAEAEVALKKKAQKVVDKMVKDAKAAYFKLGDSPGDPPYIAQAPAVDQLEARVRGYTDPTPTDSAPKVTAPAPVPLASPPVLDTGAG